MNSAVRYLCCGIAKLYHNTVYYNFDDTEVICELGTLLKYINID